MKSSTNPFGSEDEEEEEEEEREAREERGKGEDNVSKDVPLESTPQAEQTRHHWLAIEKTISIPYQLTDPFLLGELGKHLTAIQKLVAKERPESMGRTGDCLEVVLSQNIVESVYVFSTRQRVHGRGIRITLLRFLTELLTCCSQPLLIHQQILRPLNRLLRACEATEDGGVTSALVPLLHQICILLQENQSLLDLFFVESKAHHPSRFLPMTQLIPHMHDVTEIGNRSRDALLLCLSLADQLPQTNLSRFIATDCNFCQVGILTLPHLSPLTVISPFLCKLLFPSSFPRSTPFNHAPSYLRLTSFKISLSLSLSPSHLPSPGACDGSEWPLLRSSHHLQLYSGRMAVTPNGHRGQCS